MPLAPGTRLGSYEVLAPIGAGGMGEVYKGRDARLGRFVAIKILPAEKFSDPDRQRRFEQEAKAASALNHPNIITVYDIGTESGVTFLVMELVSGKSLDQLIPRTGMRISEILRVGAQISDALSNAHANGIVHRDLKPANVMITADGLVKVLDFGLAKLTQPAGPQDDATRTIAAHTEVGTVVGTVAYMSPEQAEGKPVDGRSDIFAFGSLLYEMATGQRAFAGESPVSTMSSILRDDPKPSEQVREDLPPQLARVIVRCMRKDPARRFQHMVDLKVELEELKQESDTGKLSAAVPSAAPGVARRSRTPIWIAVAAMAVIAALVGYRLLAGRAAPEPPRQAVALTSSTTPVQLPKTKVVSKSTAKVPPAEVQGNPPATQSVAPLAKKVETSTPAAQPEEAQVTSAAKIAYDQGMRLMDQEKPAEAVPHFDDAIRANPDYSSAYLGRAAARRLLSQYEASIEDCNRAIHIGPDKARPYFCRGMAEGLLKQYDLAVRDDSEAIRLDPDFVTAYDNRGNAYSNLGQYDRALEDFSQAIRLRPNIAQAYMRRAQVYEQLKQYKSAIQDYDEVIRIQPGSPRAYNGRANVKKLSGDGRGAAADRRQAKQLREQ